MSDTVISSVFICPKCKYTNPQKSKFCMQCGTPLSNISNPSQTGKLILIENGSDTNEFSITEKTILGKGNDISVEGADFSKNICEFHLSNGKLQIKTFQNGVYLKLNEGASVSLESGSELKIGNKHFRVEF
ncbi:MAG: zinc ribbon domain-containing protein [Leptospiraceae bacterium]|nr:zinc ribbon domain-containing protein [Leptospiraceae bacterium]